MTILFSPSLNTEFDTNVIPLDQIPNDALPNFNTITTSIENAEEVSLAIEIKADVLANSLKSKKG